MIRDENITQKIAAIVEKLKRAWQPEKIILFGSYALGEPTEDSDVDILVITRRCLSLEETYKIRRELLRDFSIPVQLICVSEEEFLETKDIIGGIAYPAARYGEILGEKS